MDMDMEMAGWIAIGWFVVALVVSVALGGVLRQVNSGPDEDDLASAMAKRKGMRFMRNSLRLAAVRSPRTSPVSDTGKRILNKRGY